MSDKSKRRARALCREVQGLSYQAARNLLADAEKMRAVRKRMSATGETLVQALDHVEARKEAT